MRSQGELIESSINMITVSVYELVYCWFIEDAHPRLIREYIGTYKSERDAKRAAEEIIYQNTRYILGLKVYKSNEDFQAKNSVPFFKIIRSSFKIY